MAPVHDVRAEPGLAKVPQLRRHRRRRITRGLGDCRQGAPRAVDGPAYVPERDWSRLTGQMIRVRSLMLDGQWRTLSAISEATGDPPASVSAQLRHLRKERFGSHIVDRRHLGNGLFEYRVTVP